MKIAWIILIIIIIVAILIFAIILFKSREKGIKVSQKKPLEPQEGVSYALRNVNSNMVITTQGVSNPLVQKPYEALDDQVWMVQYNQQKNAMEIKNAKSGLLMSVLHASREPGAPIIVYEYRGTNNQFWKIIPADVGFRIVNLESGLYIGIQNDSLEMGASIVQQNYSESNSQKWRFEAILE